VLQRPLPTPTTVATTVVTTVVVVVVVKPQLVQVDVVGEDFEQSRPYFPWLVISPEDIQQDNGVVFGDWIVQSKSCGCCGIVVLWYH